MHVYRCPDCGNGSECKARNAIRVAVENGDSIHELEFVGVNARTLSTLDDAGVVYLEQLLRMNPDEILQINSIGETSLQQILQGLCEFNLVAPIRCKRERELYRLVAKCRKEFFENRNFHYEPNEGWEDVQDDDEIMIDDDMLEVFNSKGDEDERTQRCG